MGVYTLCVLVIWFCESAPARVRVGCVCVCVHMLWTVNQTWCVYVVCDCEYLLLVWQVHVCTGGGLLFLMTSFNKAACLICVDVFFNSVLIHKGSRIHLYFTVFMCVQSGWNLSVNFTWIGKWFETVWTSYPPPTRTLSVNKCFSFLLVFTLLLVIMVVKKNEE